ncbi:patatin-like phospholipase family protein [Pedobacter psychroterrae]|uniref:Patatin-like phospholipase family protein n=1 Tax=Pedobacter psychroterrae TaxID=2530453 RepID=A0A4R0NJH3_9SPHI|nr:patatin-like phospholipase family protein [Pedobacter psychroterrae]TCC99967.1 patatin-like phospholipase family protein [Pedobacter psychroterrae]
MKTIALAFSGGGFRAAAFSLGTLSYLNSIKYEGEPLLRNVKFIGSTSGGSLTNAMYSTGLCREHSFEEIFGRIYAAMDGDRLITRVFAILANEKHWMGRPHKSRNLINAFSIAYNESNLLDDQEFGLISQKLSATHLEQITINATEFTNGISFRFQSQQSGISSGRIGNNYIYFKAPHTSVSDKLKLSDIVASSSCFPGGFEPFLFPDDFSHKELSREILSGSIVFKENPFSVPNDRTDAFPDEQFLQLEHRFGLMDGGVADNQAIDSVLKANSRRLNSGRPAFDLIIATDVSSYFMNGYTLPMEKHGWTNYFTSNCVYWFMLLFGLLFPLWCLFTQWQEWYSLLLTPALISLVLSLCISSKLHISMVNASKEKNTWLIIVHKFVGFFLGQRLSVLNQMLTVRLKSVMLLVDDIYLKQIRRHYYNMLYRDPELRKIIVSNAIYDLSKVKQKAQDDDDLDEVIGPNSFGVLDNSIDAPSQLLIDVAEQARLMPTTLWYDQHQTAAKMRETIIATGQFTTCYNLLKYVNKMEKVPDAPLTNALVALKQQLERDWARFNLNPFYLMKTP